MNLLISIIFFVFFAPTIYGYGTGAPKQACLDMTPQHDGIPPQPGQVSHHVFKIIKDIYTFQPGEKIPISLHVLHDKPQFKGFMIQVCFLT